MSQLTLPVPNSFAGRGSLLYYQPSRVVELSYTALPAPKTVIDPVTYFYTGHLSPNSGIRNRIVEIDYQSIPYNADNYEGLITNAGVNFIDDKGNYIIALYPLAFDLVSDIGSQLTDALGNRLAGIYLNY